MFCAAKCSERFREYHWLSFPRLLPYWLVGELFCYAQQCLPDLTPEQVLRLELGPDLCDGDQLAVVCLLATGLVYIWETRVQKKAIHLYKMRAEVEAKISILRKSRYWASGNKMLDMMN